MDKDSKLLELVDLTKLDDMAPGLKDYQKFVHRLERLFPQHGYEINRYIDTKSQFNSKETQAVMEAYFKIVGDEHSLSDEDRKFDQYYATTSVPYQSCERNESTYESRIVKLNRSSMVTAQENAVYAISFNPSSQLEESELNCHNLVAIIARGGIYKIERADFSVSGATIILEEITDEVLQREVCRELAHALEVLPSIREPGIKPELYEKDLKELEAEHKTIYFMLYHASVRSLGELVACTEDELRRIPKFGTVSLAKVKKFLKSKDLLLRVEEV